MSETRASGPPGGGDGIAFAGKRFKVRVETVPQPVGGTVRFEIVETPAAAAVVPLLAPDASRGGNDPLVVLVEQQRPAVKQRTLEIPAGLVDAHPGGADQPEPPEQTARRELEEETGYQVPSGSLRLLTRLFTSPGITDEVIHIYLASGIPAQRQRGGPEDPSEIAGVRTVPLSEAVAAIARGEIQDSKTIAGLLLARDVLRAGGGASGPIPGNDGGANMPADPTNMPQGVISNDPVSGARPNSLTAENILTQEFGYANTTAYQAQEDRARFFGLYLTLVGILAAALGAVAQLGGSFNRELLLPVAALLLALAGLLGIIFFTLLIRLRQAWFNSALAMNTIKQYYIERLTSELPDIKRAFLWKLETVPTADKRGTPTHIVCYTTAVISSFCLALAAGICGAWIGSNGWIQQSALAVSTGIARPWLDTGIYGLSVILAIVVVIVSMKLYDRYYRKQLASKKREEAIEKQEATLAGDA